MSMATRIKGFGFSQVSKECLKQLRLTSDDDHATPDEEKLSAIFDVIRVWTNIFSQSSCCMALLFVQNFPLLDDFSYTFRKF